MKIKFALLLLTVALLGTLLIACDTAAPDSGTEGESVTAETQSPETRPAAEATTEAPTAALTEAPTQAATETPATEPEETPEATSEPVSETAPETTPDTQAEAETESETDPETESETAPATEAETEPVTEPETLSPSEELAATLRSKDQLRAKTRKLADIKSDGVSTTVQGGYTDGTYHYQLFIKKDTASDEENNIVRLVKYDLESGKQVQVSDPLPLNHANDLTYNSKRGVFVAVHNNPHRKWVSLIDPETLTVIETIKMEHKIYSISYNEERDQYVVGLSGGQTFRYLDADFKAVDDVIFQPTELTKGYTTQGATSDANFIYFVLYNQNVITVYDWDGNFVTLIKLMVNGEPENLSVVDGTIYVATGHGGICSVYRVENLV